MPGDVFVKDSQIDGKGVFAGRAFRQGEVVLTWDISHELTEEEAKKWLAKEKNYVSVIGGKILLMQPPERFVNHSCDPNTTIRDFCDIAIRGIEKGEEITGNYSEDRDPDFEMRCHCGSGKCRKVIR